MRDAIAAGRGFLLSRQDHDGFWRDYRLTPGASTAWVTAVVGRALTGAGADAALGQARSAVAAARRPTGWGFNAAVATDADSTAWVLRWLNALGAAPPATCLDAYISPAGGARTFVADPRYGRWTDEHVDVTAVVGLALSELGGEAATLARVRDWLLGRRDANGLWTSFWWSIDAYAIAQTLELLAATGGIPADVRTAARGYLDRRAADPSALEAAQRLTIARLVEHRREAALAELLGAQLPDGGWPPSRVLLVPDQHSSATGAAFEDGRRLMSTAMAVLALAG